MNVTECLDKAGVDYALCGGLALGILAEPRYTRDIDLLIQEDDLDKAQEALKKIKFDLSSGIIPFQKENGEHREIVRISKAEGRDLMILDLLIVEEDLSFAWETRELYEYEGKQLKVVSKEGLISMKELAGRPQDLVDIEKLKKS